MTTTKDAGSPTTILLIHGLWLTGLSWEHWVDRFSKRGFRVIAPSWPGMDGDIDALRADPSGITRLGVEDVVAHYEAIIRDLSSPPIIIGHSFGGLITEILLDRGVGAAGVAIDPAPVKGIFVLPFSSIKSALPGLKNPFEQHRAVALTPEEFHYGFTNNLSVEESAAIYNRYAVPGPNHVLFQASLANFNPHAATTVDFHNDSRAPLLLIGGGHDHVAPAAVTRANYALFAKSKAVTDYHEFPERSHYTIGEPGWEAVADFALDWAVRNAGAKPVHSTDGRSERTAATV